MKYDLGALDCAAELWSLSSDCDSAMGRSLKRGGGGTKAIALCGALDSFLFEYITYKTRNTMILKKKEKKGAKREGGKEYDESPGAEWRASGPKSA